MGPGNDRTMGEKTPNTDYLTLMGKDFDGPCVGFVTLCYFTSFKVDALPVSPFGLASNKYITYMSLYINIIHMCTLHTNIVVYCLHT